MPLKSQAILDLHQTECNGCPRHECWGNYKHPHMEPEGPTSSPLYILGAHPETAEDNQGKVIAGLPRKYVFDALEKNKLPEPRINNAIRCVPANPKKGFTWRELESCRPSIIRDILVCRPKVIVTLGAQALSWAAGTKTNILSWAGKPFQAKIELDDPNSLLGSWTCWVVPIMDPGNLLRDRGGDMYREFHRHFKTVKEVLDTFPAPVTIPVESLDKQQTVIWSAAQLKQAMNLVPWEYTMASLDIETSGLSPQKEHILTLAFTVSIQGKDCTYSVPLLHPDNPEVGVDSEVAIKEKFELLGDFFGKFKVIVFHNATFDMRFLVKAMGERVLNWNVHDTMAMSYVLDTHSGIHSLNSCALLHLGMEHFKDSSDVDVVSLSEAPLNKVLAYNGRDAAATLQLSRVLSKKLGEQGMWDVYMMHKERLLPITRMMLLGVPLNPKEVDRQCQESFKKEQDIRMAIARDSDVVAWLKSIADVDKFPIGGFNPASVPQIKKMMVHAGHLKPGDSTDEESLSTVRAPIAKLILNLRSSTRRHALFEDYLTRGKTVYPSFNHTLTRTARLSCNDPNMQNLEKGEPRAIVQAPEGHVILGADYGQLEAIVIASTSRDEYFIKALREGLDVHAQCAKELIEIAPKLRKLVGGNIFDSKKFDEFRSAVKNQWTFPSFYLASAPSRAGYMGITLEQAYEYDEIFWRRFEGVRRWQQQLTSRYQIEGVMMGPTGRRYTGIMSPNDLANWGIQGAASDIVVAAGNRCVRHGLIPNANIHDELFFIVREEELEAKTALLISLLLTKPGTDTAINRFGWLNAPLSITVKSGKDWSQMKTIGKYVSEWKQ